MAREIASSAEIICARTPEPPGARYEIPSRLLVSRPADNALSEFLRHSRPWSGVRVPLPHRLRHALWLLVPVELPWGVWLVTIVTDPSRCNGPICSVATLDQHAAVLLIFAAVCLTGLVGLAPATRWLSQGNGQEVAGLCIAAAAGGAALLGIAALLLGAAVVLIIFAAFFVALTASS